MVTAARVFTLAAALGLSATTGDARESAMTFLALCVVAAVMSFPLPLPGLRVWAALAEAALAALVLGAAGQNANSLLAYLVVPPLAAGLAHGRCYAVAAVVTEVAALFGGLFAGHSVDHAGSVAVALGPWLLAGAGMGLLGSWVRDATPDETVDQASYESAHRLLAQLRAVSRRLSSGLDAFSLAQHTLNRSVADLDAYRAVLLVRSEGHACLPLSIHGEVPFFDTPEQDVTVLACWSGRRAAQRRMPSGSAQARTRVAFPLQVGPRLIGAVVADRAEPVERALIDELSIFLDEQALKLESALLFEEVRSIATMEERHRLAREIHDGVAQEVASLGYLVDSLADCTDQAQVREVYLDLRRELSRIVSELRLSIFDLRSGVSAQGGLGAALSDYAREIGTRSGMAVHLALSEHPRRLPAEVETQFLRIAQEAITNARKHSEARNLWINLSCDSSTASLSIADDGVGAMAERPNHHGLAIMRERAERVGANLVLGERAGGGSRVCVAIERQPHHSQGATSVDLSAAR